MYFFNIYIFNYIYIYSVYIQYIYINIYIYIYIFISCLKSISGIQGWKQSAAINSPILSLKIVITLICIYIYIYMIDLYNHMVVATLIM